MTESQPHFKIIYFHTETQGPQRETQQQKQGFQESGKDDVCYKFTIGAHSAPYQPVRAFRVFPSV